jgi:predicted phosphodiesterase
MNKNPNRDQIFEFIRKHPKPTKTVIARELNMTIPQANHYLETYRGNRGKEKLTIDKKSTVEIIKPDKRTKKEQSLFDLVKAYGYTEKQVKELLKPKFGKITPIPTNGERTFKIGVVSDTHLCDKACDVSALHDIYQRFEKAKVLAVLHAGDIVAGSGVYRGQVNDLMVHGYSDQLRYAKEYYPKIDGIKTYAISGNHDLSFKVNAGAHFLDSLCERRQDIINCGDYDGNIVIGGVKIGLHHGGGGSAYAKSYKLQKAIEAIGGGQKPQIYIMGHYHTALYMFLRNIHAFMGGCFQGPNDLSVRLNLPNTIGGWLLTITVENDNKNTIRSIVPEYIAYY